MGSAPRTKILIAVGDDNRERLTRVLEGHELVFVADGDEARECLENHRFGLVCCTSTTTAAATGASVASSIA